MTIVLKRPSSLTLTLSERATVPVHSVAAVGGTVDNILAGCDCPICPWLMIFHTQDKSTESLKLTSKIQQYRRLTKHQGNSYAS